MTPQVQDALLPELSARIRWFGNPLKHDAADIWFDAKFGFAGEANTNQPPVQFDRAIPLRQLINVLQDPNIEVNADDVIAEIGSGSGRLALALTLLTGARVKAIEINSSRYERACQLLAQSDESCAKNIELFCADARDFCYEGVTAAIITHVFLEQDLRLMLDHIHSQARTSLRYVFIFGRLNYFSAIPSFLEPCSGSLQFDEICPFRVVSVREP